MASKGARTSSSTGADMSESLARAESKIDAWALPKNAIATASSPQKTSEERATKALRPRAVLTAPHAIPKQTPSTTQTLLRTPLKACDASTSNSRACALYRVRRKRAHHLRWKPANRFRRAEPDPDWRAASRHR